MSAAPPDGRPAVPVPGIALLDVDRRRRTGLPEMVLADGKTPEQVATLLAAMAEAGEVAIATRASPAHWQACQDHPALGAARYDPVGRTIALGRRPPHDAARVTLFCAGTADLPVAREAEAVLQALGARTQLCLDVGLAGPARSALALAEAAAFGAKAWIVLAGRDAALATYVAAHADVPVFGVPTSVGYGFGGGGTSALMAMLQSCAPLAVVNVDAGCVAALLAWQVVRRRSGPVPEEPAMAVAAVPA